MLTVHRAERTAVLADALADLLRTPLADPFAAEVVAVPAQGVERWLAQRLSTVLGAGAGGDGVCSGVVFPSPSRLVEDALAAAGGTAPRDEPWAAPLWPLLEVVDACVGEPWCAVLAQHVGAGEDGHRRGRRWSTAARLTALFGSYAAHRPQMLRDWAAGRDTDGTGELAPDLRWQAGAVAAAARAARAEPGGAARRAVRRAGRRPERAPLPERLSLFGPTRLRADQLEVLAALGRRPRRARLAAAPEPRAVGAAAREDRPCTGATTRRPRCRSTRCCAATRATSASCSCACPPHDDVHHPDVARPGDAARPPAGRPARGPRARPRRRGGRHRAGARLPRPGPAGGGAAGGAAAAVRGRRPTSSPATSWCCARTWRRSRRWCRPPSGSAPGLPHPGHALRVRLADRSLRATNPLLDTVARLLGLAGSRVTASAVLDLAASPAVRRRFALDDDDLERVRDWVARSGVRWGIDAEGRAPYGMSAVPQNTWRTGLDRLLLGVTTSEDEPVWLDRALPLDDVDSSDIDLAGRLAELLDRLEDVLGRLTGEQPASAWVAALADGLDALTEVAEADAWQLAQARRELAEAAAGSSVPVRLADVRAMLADRLRGRPTRAGFRTGSLTVCTLVPMRSVPHRVVVLLGLDDGVFPRTSGVDGDDVLARDPRLGERDVRSEDRQLLLDAVLSAGERLVVLHTGADPVSGAARPPAVPVGELLDVVEAMAPGGREAVVVRHPLQPYDRRDFRAPTPFSFDPVSLAGARRASAPRRAPAPDPPLPPLGGDVALDDLVAFVEHPVRGLPAAAAGADAARRGRRGRRRAAGRARRAAGVGRRRAHAGRGAGRHGPVRGPAGGVAARHAAAGAAGRPGAGEGAGPRRAARRGRRPGARRAGPHRRRAAAARRAGCCRARSTACAVAAVVSVAYSTLAAKHRARAWVLGLALAAAGEGDRAVTVGRRGNRARRSTLVAPPDALAALAALVDLRDRGLREPLPLAGKTSAAYAAARLGGNSPEQALESAGKEWVSDYGGEQEDRSHVHVWGDRAPLDALLEQVPRDGEAEPGEPTRFGSLACRLWAPVLDAEEVT